MKIFLTLLILMGAAYAEPFVPVSDSQVLERLPYRVTDLKAQELRRLRVELSRKPNHLVLAIKLAWRYVRLGRSEADPRYYGYAQSVLQPWWEQAQPPAPVLLLRATLRQNRHDFSAALSDLAQLLKLQPGNAQAWLTRAVVATVMGDYEQAAASCMPLRRLASTLISNACISNVLGLSGRAERAYAQLAKSLENASTAPTEEHVWALTTLAEIAVRLGWNRAAERHFQTALALDPRDVYLLSAYADFLLDQERPESVRRLLQGKNRIDALLLRLALAEQRLNKAAANTFIEQLQRRFEAIRRRGTTTHLGAAGRFALELQGQAETALRLALANWQQQHEPRDAHLVLAAALAAQEPSAARPVLTWLEQTGLEDVRIAALVARYQERGR